MNNPGKKSTAKVGTRYDGRNLESVPNILAPDVYALSNLSEVWAGL